MSRWEERLAAAILLDSIALEDLALSAELKARITLLCVTAGEICHAFVREAALETLNENFNA